MNHDGEVLWEFLAPSSPPKNADVIFVFGGINRKVPRRAAELFAQGFAKSMLITGGAGALTHRHFEELEAVVFRDEAIAGGVPESAITIETAASNTGQNVELGMEALHHSGATVQSLLLVSAPFIMKRCVATFAKQFPGVEVTPCPPPGRAADFMDRPEREYAARLVAEIDRLVDYSALGFTVPVAIPEEVRAASERIRAELTEP